MADFTQTITNTIVLVGPADASLWGTMLWGTGFWGTDSDLDLGIEKVFGNTVTASDSYSKSADKSVSTNTVGVITSLPTIILQDSNGFCYVFPSDNKNAAQNPDTTYSQVAGATDAWTTFPINGTTWGEA